MRAVFLGSAPENAEEFFRWARTAFTEIENASNEGIEHVADAFEVTGTITEQRTFDAETADLEDLRNVFATFINDLKKRGPKAS